MSRDWTPEESYLVEQQNIKNGRGSWWDLMETATWHINGQSWPMHSKESIENRKKFPLLGRLYNDYDKLYAFLTQVSGGPELLSKLENELDGYIKTGLWDDKSYLLRWFTGTLDEHFYYSTRNDELFMESVKNEIGRQYRCDPTSGRCFWFALSEDKCFSAWYAPDPHDGDQLQMKLEERAEDGSMGPHCELVFDESYGTDNLSFKAIQETLSDIYHDAGLGIPSETTLHEMTDRVMSVFSLKKSLDDQIKGAETKKELAPGQESPKLLDLEH